MALMYTDEQLELVIKILGELYYKHAVPVERYKKFDGWYENTAVIDRNAVDYELWKVTGKHFGYDGLTREDFIKDYAQDKQHSSSSITEQEEEETDVCKP